VFAVAITQQPIVLSLLAATVASVIAAQFAQVRPMLSRPMVEQTGSR
jgi:hypothetical protein